MTLFIVPAIFIPVVMLHFISDFSFFHFSVQISLPFHTNILLGSLTSLFPSLIFQFLLFLFFLQSILICVGCLPELDDKTPLRKTLHALVIDL